MLSCHEIYVSELSLKPAKYGSHTLGACDNRTILGLSVPPLIYMEAVEN
jgi:hypothetical protein